MILEKYMNHKKHNSEGVTQKLTLTPKPISPVPGFVPTLAILGYKNINPSGLIQTLEKLRDILLPKLMSGEVRVKIEDANPEGMK